MKLLSLILIFFLTAAPSFAKEQPPNNTVEVDVKGMVCDFCARGLEKLFGKRDEVKKIDINLKKGLVKIEFKEKKSLDDKTIEKIIVSNGISVSKINRKQRQK